MSSDFGSYNIYNTPLRQKAFQIYYFESVFRFVLQGSEDRKRYLLFIETHSDYINKPENILPLKIS